MELSDRQRFRSFRSRRTLFAGGLVALVLALLLGCYFYDQSRDDLISPGVTAQIVGLTIGGMATQVGATPLLVAQAAIVAIGAAGAVFLDKGNMVTTGRTGAL